jgi:hypothetical protein
MQRKKEVHLILSGADQKATLKQNKWPYHSSNQEDTRRTEEQKNSIGFLTDQYKQNLYLCT